MEDVKSPIGVHYVLPLQVSWGTGSVRVVVSMKKITHWKLRKQGQRSLKLSSGNQAVSRRTGCVCSGFSEDGGLCRTTGAGGSDRVSVRPHTFLCWLFSFVPSSHPSSSFQPSKFAPLGLYHPVFLNLWLLVEFAE